MPLAAVEAQKKQDRKLFDEEEQEPLILSEDEWLELARTALKGDKSRDVLNAEDLVFTIVSPKVLTALLTDITKHPQLPESIVKLSRLLGRARLMTGKPALGLES